jgi:hypothetical protein
VGIPWNCFDEIILPASVEVRFHGISLHGILQKWTAKWARGEIAEVTVFPWNLCKIDGVPDPEHCAVEQE